MNSSISKISLLLFCVLGIVLTSCDSGQADKVPIEDTNPTSADIEQSESPMSVTPGMLDTLWIAAEEFKKLDKSKASFVFYFGANDTITVHGWKDKTIITPYTDTPTVKFLKGKPDSALTYGTGTYFGNSELKNVKDIVKLIDKEKYDYVIFAPKLLYNHVFYVVYLSKEPHTLAMGMAGLGNPVGETNPSPPKP